MLKNIDIKETVINQIFARTQYIAGASFSEEALMAHGLETPMIPYTIDKADIVFEDRFASTMRQFIFHSLD
jgi:hypothetical protein